MGGTDPDARLRLFARRSSPARWASDPISVQNLGGNPAKLKQLRHELQSNHVFSVGKATAHKAKRRSRWPTTATASSQQRSKVAGARTDTGSCQKAPSAQPIPRDDTEDDDDALAHTAKLAGAARAPLEDAERIIPGIVEAVQVAPRLNQMDCPQQQGLEEAESGHVASGNAAALLSTRRVSWGPLPDDEHCDSNATHMGGSSSSSGSGGGGSSTAADATHRRSPSTEKPGRTPVMGAPATSRLPPAPTSAAAAPPSEPRQRWRRRPQKHDVSNQRLEPPPDAEEMPVPEDQENARAEAEAAAVATIGEEERMAEDDAFEQFEQFQKQERVERELVMRLSCAGTCASPCLRAP